MLSIRLASTRVRGAVIGRSAVGPPGRVPPPSCATMPTVVRTKLILVRAAVGKSAPEEKFGDLARRRGGAHQN